MAQAGDNIVSTPNLYGGTFNQFKVTLKRLGIEVRFTSREERPEEFLALTDEKTRAWWVESIGNPALNIPDPRGPGPGRPGEGGGPHRGQHLRHGGLPPEAPGVGAALVTHSLTKWVGGHGAVIAGAIVDGGNFPWEGGRYPLLTEPQPGYHGLRLTEAFGELAFIVKARVDGLRDQGQALGPFEAWVVLLGMETLSLRAERHVENTLHLAHWLLEQPQVAWVNYPGLPHHPHHDRAQKYFKGKPGAVLTFGLKGGYEAAKRFISRLKLISHLANVGDTRTLAIHPASTTHSQLSPEEQAQAGVSPEMVRLSVGLEHVEDLKAELKEALA